MSKAGRDIEEANTVHQAELLNLHYLDVRTLYRKPIYKKLIPFEEMRAHKLTPIVIHEASMVIGITIMTPKGMLEKLDRRFNHKRVKYVLISPSALREYFNLYNPAKKLAYQDIDISETGDIEEFSTVFKNVRSEDMLAYLAKQAFHLKASDIHCENEKNYVRIRLRIYGVLHPILKITKDTYHVLVAAVASEADISTSSKDAQTGHIGRTYLMGDGSEFMVNLRVETAPSLHGMDIVMRFFNFDREMLNMDRLGMSKFQAKAIHDIVQYPRGLVLVVGPTGSGKTTTMYSIISELLKPSLKIITLEDPVEFQIEGVTQIPIDTDKGASFADGLRTVLRLDPDAVMLGEIRDSDTAKTALQASLTGHLVISTYHANSAATALTRLLDATLENPLYLNSIRLIQGQRLVRRLDDKTKQAYQPSKQELKQIKTVIKGMANPPPDLDLEDLQLYKPGYSAENPYGFNGRLALRELLFISDGLVDLVSRKGLATTSKEIEAYLRETDGMRTMIEEGILKVIKGETTLEEVYQALG